MTLLFSIASVSLLTHLVHAVPYVASEGSNFIVEGNGNRFDVIGLDYQPGGSSGFNGTGDPLSDPEACLRDAVLMQQLGINTIRVYNLATDVNHDQCASIFNAAGIYMILDVNNPLQGQYLDRTDPQSTYTFDYLNHVFGVIEAFADYPNTLGFFAANEIINQQSSSNVPAYLRAVVRDMNDYISHNIGRQVGVGYSAADVETLLQDTWNYLACNIGDSQTSKISFFGLNDYEWCGDNTFTGSGWDKLVALFDGTTIPVFLSEYGCIKVRPRLFEETTALYSSDMQLFSGGLVYEYSQETDDYGIVSINSSTELELLQDYSTLAQRLSEVDLSHLMVANPSATAVSAKDCSTVTVSNTAYFPTDFSIPAAPSGIDSVISGGLTSASWWTKGALATVTATTMPATVMNYTGDTIQSNSYSLVEYACDQINAPGKAATYTYPSNTPSCSYQTSRPTESSSSSGHKNGAATKAVCIWPLAAIIGSLFAALQFL